MELFVAPENIDEAGIAAGARLALIDEVIVPFCYPVGRLLRDSVVSFLSVFNDFCPGARSLQTQPPIRRHLHVWYIP